jgi:hypothetical protein
MKLRQRINVLQIGGGRTLHHRDLLRILIVSVVTAFLLASPMGSLPAAQDFNVALSSSAKIQGKPLPLFNETSAAETVQQVVSVRIAPGLQRLIAQSAAVQASAGRLPQAAARDRIKVMFHLADGTTLDPRGILSQGGRILRHRPNLVAVEIPSDQIETVLHTEQGIVFARLPHRFRPLGVTSEGVGLTGATIFHGSGYRGAGLKVAVIDVGFKGLTQAKSTGDLPTNVITRDFTGRGLETQYKHGTACAEIIHDMAPDAELHLLKIADEEDFYAAYYYCLEQRINIISLSIGTFGSGPGNGTGPIHDVCNEARANGILVVAAAGNGGNFSSGDIPVGTHWEGTFTDANQDTIHEFLPGVQRNILLASQDYDDDGNPENDEVTIVMRWNDWPTAVTDYDMYLYDYDYQTGVRGGLVAFSAGVQNGSQPPVEHIVVDLPNDQPDRYYELVVVRNPGSPAGKEIEIFLGGKSFFVAASFHEPPIATSAGSIMEPADAASVFAVGAINHSQWSWGPQEYYSSQGPTNAWAGSAARIKPDICGPDGVSSNTYGVSFPGTSAAAPHVAGAAALLWSLHPNLLPGEVQSSLESWALDMGDPGKDNLYGWGRLRLITYFLSIFKFGSGTISSTPNGINCGSSCSASYPSGTNVTLTATADPNSTFVEWGGGCSGAGQCTVTMDASKSVSATFSLDTYVITLPPIANGTISCNPMVVNHGSNTSCIITPSIGYHFATLTDNGADVTTAMFGNTYTINNVFSKHTINPTFEINTYTLAISKAGTGSGTVTGAPGGINCGDTCWASYVVGTETPVTLTAIPTLGSTFTGWSGGGCTGIENCSLIINNNIQLTALFANPWGDVNNDGKIDLTDAILSLWILSKMDTAGKIIAIAADANNDNKIGLAEVIYILQRVAGLR